MFFHAIFNFLGEVELKSVLQSRFNIARCVCVCVRMCVLAALP